MRHRCGSAGPLLGTRPCPDLAVVTCAAGQRGCMRSFRGSLFPRESGCPPHRRPPGSWRSSEGEPWCLRVPEGSGRCSGWLPSGLAASHRGDGALPVASELGRLALPQAPGRADRWLRAWPRPGRRAVLMKPEGPDSPRTLKRGGDQVGLGHRGQPPTWSDAETGRRRAIAGRGRWRKGTSRRGPPRPRGGRTVEWTVDRVHTGSLAAGSGSSVTLCRLFIGRS